jgi:hypothetical protein
MQVFEAMTTNVVSAMPETTLMDAALIMKVSEPAGWSHS